MGGGAPLAAAKKVGNHGASYESLDYDKCINKYYMEKEKEITKHATALPGRTTRARHPGSPRAEGRSARTHAVTSGVAWHVCAERLQRLPRPV